MCFFDVLQYTCGDQEWAAFEKYCSEKYENGPACGLKLAMQLFTIQHDCTICEVIATKEWERRLEIMRISRLKTEGIKYQASIDKANANFDRLSDEIHKLVIERRKCRANRIEFDAGAPGPIRDGSDLLSRITHGGGEQQDLSSDSEQSTHSAQKALPYSLYRSTGRYRLPPTADPVNLPTKAPPIPSSPLVTNPSAEKEEVLHRIGSISKPLDDSLKGIPSQMPTKSASHESIPLPNQKIPKQKESKRMSYTISSDCTANEKTLDKALYIRALGKCRHGMKEASRAKTSTHSSTDLEPAKLESQPSHKPESAKESSLPTDFNSQRDKSSFSKNWKDRKTLTFDLIWRSMMGKPTPAPVLPVETHDRSKFPSTYDFVNRPFPLDEERAQDQGTSHISRAPTSASNGIRGEQIKLPPKQNPPEETRGLFSSPENSNFSRLTANRTGLKRKATDTGLLSDGSNGPGRDGSEKASLAALGEKRPRLGLLR